MHVLHQRFGVEGRALTWFVSYLCNRTQAFYHKTQQSGPYKVDCSVPTTRVSTVGPKEFIAYTEELAVLIDSYQLCQHLYADDAQLMKRAHASTRRIHHRDSAAIHRGHSQMVFIATTSAQSIENRSYLVRHNTQFEKMEAHTSAYV